MQYTPTVLFVSKMPEVEWKTRKERIDRWLKSLPQSWKLVLLKKLRLRTHRPKFLPAANEQTKCSGLPVVRLLFLLAPEGLD